MSKNKKEDSRLSDEFKRTCVGPSIEKQEAAQRKFLNVLRKNSPIGKMYEQIQSLCKRMDEVEGAVCTGYIYPKTLPTDAVIVIRAEGRISQAAMASIKEGVAGVWPANKCLVLCDGMSMEIYEGDNQ